MTTNQETVVLLIIILILFYTASKSCCNRKCAPVQAKPAEVPEEPTPDQGLNDALTDIRFLRTPSQHRKNTVETMWASAASQGADAVTETLTPFRSGYEMKRSGADQYTKMMWNTDRSHV